MKSLFSKSDKNIGIIGYWFATNYGGVASYYSLYRQIESLGYNPFFVDNPYAATDKEGADVFSRNFFKNEKFNVAPTYDINNLPELNKKTDTFLLGSDQVLTSFSIRAFGKLFLMDFTEPNKRRIAYSSSCGGDNLDSSPELLKYAQNQLKKFNAVSVREYSAVDLLQKKFDIKADVTVDPIFFTSAREYAKLGEKSETVTGENYLLAYVLDPTPDKKKCLEMISEELGLAPKIALDGRKFTHQKNFEKMDMPDATLPELDFYEWLKYYSHASYIFTDSFHGAVMSLILNKPCIIYINKGRGYPRFVTLGKMFGIESRMIENSDALSHEKITAKINFKHINALQTKEIKKAATWLKSSLSVNDLTNQLKNNTNIAIDDPLTSEINRLHENPDFIKIRLLATLLRDYGIKHVVLSPGGRDVPLIRMFENNADQFILHRVTDERSAAYFGLGIAAQLRQPVACVCTSGTAASNYLPAVTEAYYTGIPLIMITADRREIYLNQGEDQTIPQKNIYSGVVKKEVSLPEGGGKQAELQSRRDISDCILESTHNTPGPVHINITIDNISIGAKLPSSAWSLLPFVYPHILRAGFNNGPEKMMDWVNSLKKSQRILVVYGQNPPPTETQLKYIEDFAKKYNCVIVTDHISNLNCAYSLQPFVMLNSISQAEFNTQLSPDILITVGGKRLMNDPLTFKIRGGYGNIRHWSVSPDGKIRDYYFRLSSVLECSQDYFFRYFAEKAGDALNNGVYYGKWKELNDKVLVPVPKSFNAHYIQSKFLPAIPKSSILHLGVGQSFFDCRRYKLDKTVDVFCNMGTNGIDGCTSTFMGQCAVTNDRLCFLLVGDLSFFYDMNSIWNKNPGNNVRILMVNNNGSGLLRSHNLRAVTSQHNTSAEGWVRSTGFEYISAKSPEEFDKLLPYFISSKTQKPIFFEVFCE